MIRIEQFYLQEALHHNFSLKGSPKKLFCPTQIYFPSLFISTVVWISSVLPLVFIPPQSLFRVSTRGVMAHGLDWSLVVSEFELQSHYNILFRINTLGKDMNPNVGLFWEGRNMHKPSTNCWHLLIKLPISSSRWSTNQGWQENICRGARYVLVSKRVAAFVLIRRTFCVKNLTTGWLTRWLSEFQHLISSKL